MNAGAWFGALFGVAVVVASRLGTMAWRVMWLAVGIQLIITATLVWERTRLPCWTAGAALAAGAAFFIALFPGGREGIQELFWRQPIVVLVGLLTSAALMFSEAHFSKEKWRQVRQRGESATLADLLRFRHIPYLR
jgi:hypothetical protein